MHKPLSSQDVYVINIKNNKRDRFPFNAMIEFAVNVRYQERDGTGIIKNNDLDSNKIRP